MSGLDLIALKGLSKLTSLLVFFVSPKQLECFDPALLLSECLRESKGLQGVHTVSLSYRLLRVSFIVLLYVP